MYDSVETYHFPCFRTCNRTRSQLQGCAIIADVDEKGLSLPIQLLCDEHVPLREQMKRYVQHANHLKISENHSEAVKTMNLLKNAIFQFIDNIDTHSEKEDEILLNQMAKYIDKDVGPVAVIENEHKQAKFLLNRLKQYVEEFPDQIPNQKETEKIIDYVNETYEILTDHFMKEEIVLFPLAEKLLSKEDKEEILKQLS